MIERLFAIFLFFGLPVLSLTQVYVLRDADAKFQDCVNDLYAADNGDMQFRRDEYLDFIELRSDGRLVFDTYGELPLSLLSTYNFAACFCALLTADNQCCVGDRASININPNDSMWIQNNVVSFCSQVDAAIGYELPPTPVPTIQPSTPTPQPSAPFTPLPTMSPAQTPTVEPGAPTAQPVVFPTVLPSVAPSVTPGSPTAQPVAFPTVLPSVAPSVTPGSPTAQPVVLPTVLPSVAPSVTPGTPTPLPSAFPTMLPVVPTQSPSVLPSASPITMAPSPSPTFEGELCVDFQFGIVNNAGVDADDILNMVGNTLVVGLVIAIENVTITTLNTTFPRDGRLLRNYRSNTLPTSSGRERLIVPAHYLAAEHSEHWQTLPLQQQSNTRQLAMIPSSTYQSASSSISQRGRRLVFYTNARAPVIRAIFDNPFCASDTPLVTRCAVASATVCVVLEEGDVEEEVRSGLLAGIASSIESGEFEQAIPVEHQLP